MIDIETRQLRINNLIGAIKVKFEQGMELEFEKLVFQTCYSYKTARRTSLEYLNIALSQIPHNLIKEKGIKWIIPLTKEETLVREA